MDTIASGTTAATTKSPSPADLLTAPLTKAFAKLSSSEEDPGIHLRPETYAQADLKEKNRDHSKLDTVDLLYGWVCVADHLLSTGGDIMSYIKHLKFAAGMLHSRRFFDAGAVKYDRFIIDKYLRCKSAGFEPDTVGSSLTFSARIIPDNIQLVHGASLTKGIKSVQLGKQTQAKWRKPGQRRDEVLADFPSDICFRYNYRQCNDDNCQKAHSCRKCHGKHRADTCRKDLSHR